MRPTDFADPPTRFPPIVAQTPLLDRDAGFLRSIRLLCAGFATSIEESPGPPPAE